MKTAEKKLEFIRLRAESKSYRAIEAEIGVSRSTCSKWDKDLSQEIARLRRENLEALYNEYGMMREERIRRIGDTLRRIDHALEAVDLSTITPEKLLDYKLKYQAALRNEYSSTAHEEATGAADDTLEAMQSLYRRIASGEITADQARAELNILNRMMDGYDRANPFHF